MCDCKCCNAKVDSKVLNKDLDLIYSSFKNDLKDLSVKYLGSEGMINKVLKSLKDVPSEERKDIGLKINKIVHNIDQHIRLDPNSVWELR